MTPSKSSRSKHSSESKKDSTSKEGEKEKDVAEDVRAKVDELKNERDTRAAARETASSEIQIGTLTTTKVADVEELLNQRNALKKEEMRERNPDFFRPV